MKMIIKSGWWKKDTINNNIIYLETSTLEQGVLAKSMPPIVLHQSGGLSMPLNEKQTRFAYAYIIVSVWVVYSF
jgi:hypothetical protein